MAFSWSRSNRMRISVLAVAVLALIGGIIGWRVYSSKSAAPAAAESLTNPAPLSGLDIRTVAADNSAKQVELPRASWEAANIELRPAMLAPLNQTIALTGKITLNQDRVAHIYPLVDGRVEDVRVAYGQQVKQGDELIVVQSREVGQSILKLCEDRLLYEFALVKDKWTQAVAENTRALIEEMRRSASIEEIEEGFRDRPLGDFREKLMSAYIAREKAQQDLERLEPLSKEGAVPAKQFLESKAEWNAARATVQSLLEQVYQDTRQASLASTQAVRELETRVSVDETNLKIIGFSQQYLDTVDPMQLGEEVSHYSIVAPFDGTVISKDVVLLERVGPDNQILSIADLSTVWVSADIFEEHLHLLDALHDKTLHIKSNAWPDQSFAAKVFYTGDLVDESSRTVSLRAVADNAQGRLKPGMFVTVEVPGQSADDVLQVPLEAVVEHEGKTFVFVHVEGDRFVRRDIVLGRRNDKVVEILSGLAPGEMTVASGAFTLKSRMLADLLAE